MAALTAAEEDAPRFIADCHLGKTAKYLRFMGYDTLYFPHIEDSDLIRLAAREGRIILTRDGALSQRKNIPVFLLRANDTNAQLCEIREHFALRDRGDDSRRCLVCNGRLEPIEKAALQGVVPEKVLARFDTFRRCSVCGRIYWNGDHYDNMMAILAAPA